MTNEQKCWYCETPTARPSLTRRGLFACAICDEQKKCCEKCVQKCDVEACRVHPLCMNLSCSCHTTSASTEGEMITVKAPPFYEPAGAVSQSVSEPKNCVCKEPFKCIDLRKKYGLRCGYCNLPITTLPSLLFDVEKCSCGEPHISDRTIHRYDGNPCYIDECVIPNVPCCEPTEKCEKHKRDPQFFSELEWEKEFREKYSIKVTVKSEVDKTKAFLLERYWQYFPIGEMVDDINAIIFSSNRAIISRVVFLIDELDKKYQYNLGLADLRSKLTDEIK